MKILTHDAFRANWCIEGVVFSITWLIWRYRVLPPTLTVPNGTKPTSFQTMQVLPPKLTVTKVPPVGAVSQLAREERRKKIVR